MGIELPVVGERITGLDGMRALAALWVCLFHINEVLPHSDQVYRQLVKWGFLGVPVFFVISGLVVSMSGSRSTTSSFVRARFWRIYPPYLSSLLISVVIIGLTWLCTGVNDLAGLPRDAGSWLQMLGLLTWPLSSTLPLNWAYWSLSIEVCLYAVLLIGIQWRALHAYVPALLSLLALLLSCYDSAWQLAIIAWSQFALGIAISMLIKRQYGRAAWLIVAGMAAQLNCAAYAQTFASVVALLLIVRLVARPEGLLSQMLEWPALRWTGVRSYSIYLLHVPLGVFFLARLRPIGSEGDFLLHPLFDLGVTLAVIGLAALHYRWVEQPAIRCSRTPSLAAQVQTLR